MDQAEDSDLPVNEERLPGVHAPPPAQDNYYATRLRRLLGQLRFLPQALRLAWDAAPRWTAAWLLLLVLQSLVPVVLVVLTRSVVNALVAVTAAGVTPERLAPVVALAAAVGALLLVAEGLRGAANYVRTVQTEYVTDHIRARTQDQSMSVDLAFYDLPDFYDHLHRASNEAAFRPQALLESLGNLLQSALTLAAMMMVLLPYGIWLPLALLVSTLPALVAVLRGTARHHAWSVRTTPLQRRAWYLDWLLSNRETAAEIRLFGLGPHFQSGYQALRGRLRSERIALARWDARAELAAATLAIVVTSGTLAVVVWQALMATLTLGDLALMVQAFNQGQQLMRSLLGHVGQIYRNSLFMGDLLTFLDMTPEIVDPPTPLPFPGPDDLPPTIRFRDLTFAYPGQRGRVLDGFSLEIPAGRTVAIVGRNGAGKSTLIKLLCRFYDPQAGAVEIAGTDVRALRLVDLRRHVTVMFQEPVAYQATARENIHLADVAAPPEAIPVAAAQAGAEEVVHRLPLGYETPLGVWFAGGTDLSVGEWQRLALARAYLRRAPIMVLDEPTSAMDPWAEAEWFRSFRQLAEGRTVLLITHRFTTARFADHICVMDQGRVQESGSHESLLSLGGAYARSWRAQMTGFEASS